MPASCGSRRRGRVALVAVLVLLPLWGTGSGAAEPPGIDVGGVGTTDGRSRLVVDVSRLDARSVPPASFVVTLDGTPRPAEAQPVMSGRLAMGVVVDGSQAGGPVLQPGASGLVDFVLEAPSTTRSALVADATPPVVVAPLQAGPTGMLAGLSSIRPVGDRQTAAALELAVQQLPREAENPRLVVLYTGAPDAAGVSAAELANRLSRAGVVLAVVTTTGGGQVSPYWSSVSTATGGVAVGAGPGGVVEAFTRLATALRAFYLLTFPAPERLPATAVVRTDLPNGSHTARAVLPAPSVAAPPAARPTGSMTGVALLVVVLASAGIGALAIGRFRLRAGRARSDVGGTAPKPPVVVLGAVDGRAAHPDGVTAAAAQPTVARQGGTVWNVPPRSEPVVGRKELLAAVRTALRSGAPAVLHAADGRPGTGTTTAMIEFAHWARDDYDTVWWIPAEDPPLVADRLAQLAEALGVAGAHDSIAQATNHLVETLRHRDRWLLIFDDADDPRELVRFIPPGPGHVLVASADPAWQDHGTTVAVPPFARTEAVDLLRARRPGLATREADRVAAALGDLPLAVDTAGATLGDTGMRVRAYLGLLSERPVPAGAAPAAAVWAVAVDRLAADDPAALALLTLVAWLGREPVPLPLLVRHADALPAPLAGTAGTPGGLVERAETLGRRGMARIGPDGLQLHRVPAGMLVARTSGERPQDVGWATWAVRLLRAAAPADPGDPASWPTWRRLLPHVLAATDPARHLDDLVEVGWLLNRAGSFLAARGEPRSARALLDDAYDLCRRRLGPDHPDTVAAARALAADLHALGRHDDARLVLSDAHIDSPTDSPTGSPTDSPIDEDTWPVSAPGGTRGEHVRPPGGETP